MKKLIVDMNGLLNLITERIEREAANPSPDPHLEICRVCADSFDLWDDEDRFPVWLSRIVEGEMRDAKESNPNVTRFTNREAAFAYSASTVKPSRVMLGDDGKFWVCTPAEAQRLEKAGYEYAR